MRYEKGSFIVVPNRKVIQGMKPATQCVYLWLCFHSNQDGECFPSIETLAREANVSRRQVFRSLSELEVVKVIEKSIRFNDKKQQQTSLYTITVNDGEGDCMAPGGCLPDTPGGDCMAHRTVSSIELNPINSSPQTDSFEKFWNAYDKKIGKKTALEIWKRGKLWECLDEILEFIEKANNTDRWKNGYKKDPERFLKLRTWTDDLATYQDYKTNRGMKVTKIG